MSVTLLLGDILSSDQLAEVFKVISTMRGDPTEPRNVQALKGVFNNWKDALEKKGINADYLAYAVACKVRGGCGAPHREAKHE